jgi:general secretion pathway protein N
LPKLAAASAPRLGPLTQYGEISARPLFTDDRRHQPFFLQPEGEEQATNTFDYILTSVLITPGFEMAIVQPTEGGDSIRIKLGAAADDAPAWRLVALNPRSAIFEGPEGQRTLELRVFDGLSGQAPTTMREPAPSGRMGTTAPAQVDVDSPQPTPSQPSSPIEQPSQAPPAKAPDAQVQAIRERIEARRAKLRSQAKPPAEQTKNP